MSAEVKSPQLVTNRREVNTRNPIKTKTGEKFGPPIVYSRISLNPTKAPHRAKPSNPLPSPSPAHHPVYPENGERLKINQEIIRSQTTTG